VTAFPDDPLAIDNERRGLCWGGKWAKYVNGEMKGQVNQYFTISVFNPDEDGRAVRRKSHFLATYVIVADDVKDKVPEAQARLLPPPSWRLETSPGNEQWGWILSIPETDRTRVENLLDGLVRQGLAPDGTDPGMRGVTRYLRLPEGWNTKSAYIAQLGAPFKCRMLEWDPEHRVSMEQLAGPFGVDLNARRSDAELGEGLEHPDHPVLNALTVLDDKGAGQYLVECPWIEEHTNGDNSGTWLITKSDGSIGFECHHGHCQDRTGADLLEKLGLRGQLDTWRAFRQLETQGVLPPAAPRLKGVDDSNGGQPDRDTEQVLPVGAPWVAAVAALPEDLNTTVGMESVRRVIGVIAQLQPLEKSAAMQALKTRCTGVISARGLENELRQAERDLRQVRAQAGGDEGVDAVFGGLVFIEGLNKFYRVLDGTLMTPEALNTSYGDLPTVDGAGEPTTPARAFAARHGKRLASGMGWHPINAEVIELDGRRLVNTYRPPQLVPEPGNVEAWLYLVRHICGQHWELVLDHMAFTVQYPERKIRWQVLIHGDPRIGKSMIVRPLARIFGGASQVVSPEGMESGYDDMYAGKKVMIVEEVYRPTDKTFYNGIKTRLANDDVEALNIKGKGYMYQQNLLSMYLFSNHGDALHFDEDDDKLLVLEARGKVFGEGQQSIDFYQQLADWIRDGSGAANIYHYLLNRDVSGFQDGQLPVRTEAYIQMVYESSPSYIKEVIDMIECEDSPFDKRAVVFDGIRQALSNRGIKFQGDKGIREALAKRGFRKFTGQVHLGGKKKKFSFWTRHDLPGRYGHEPDKAEAAEYAKWYIEEGGMDA
jgi:hypothetical protein